MCYMLGMVLSVSSSVLCSDEKWPLKKHVCILCLPEIAQPPSSPKWLVPFVWSLGVSCKFGIVDVHVSCALSGLHVGLKSKGLYAPAVSKGPTACLALCIS